MDYVDLGDIDKAFTQGGNRLCFVDPRDAKHCIKVLRPDRTPRIRRRQKGFPKNLRPLSSFDENLQEYRVWQTIEKEIGEPAFDVISRCYGFVRTNYGNGLVMELIRDSDGKISKTLKQSLWEEGLTPAVENALSSFANAWAAIAMPSKKLLLHNMLLRKSNHGHKIYVIDGLGWSSLLPLSKYIKWLAKKRSQKKIQDLQQLITEFLENKQQGSVFGYHGWLDDKQRTVTARD